MESIVARTAYPFEFRDTGTAGRSARHAVQLSADSAQQLSAQLAPLFDDHVLERTMQSERDGRLELREQLPHWAEPWRDYQPPGAQQFDAYFHAPDAAFSIILFTDGAGVRALWKNGFDASLQVALATQWLDALNQRDLEALARVTSYPFQLRDSEAESQCGARQANNAAQLPAALDCLLGDSPFSLALRERSTRIEAAPMQDYEPDMFRGWRRPEHAMLCSGPSRSWSRPVQTTEPRPGRRARFLEARLSSLGRLSGFRKRSRVDGVGQRMNNRNLSNALVLFAALPIAFSCKPPSEPSSAVRPSASEGHHDTGASAPADPAGALPSAAMEVAGEWVSALGRGDWLAGLFADDVLIRTIAAERDGQVTDNADIPYWAEPWRQDLPSGMRPLQAYFSAKDAAFSFILFADEVGVRGLWMNGFDASLEIALGTQWLDALRQKDVDTLETLTSYPFELRDSEADAHCGSRTATSPKQFVATVNCLLGDALLGKALGRIRSGVEAGLTQDDEPDIFKGWRRPEHAGLWSATLLISAAVGDGTENEFDLCLLVAKNGVRAFWKRGTVLSGD